MATPERARRTFQIVVAATKQWGIGKGALRYVTTPSQGCALQGCYSARPSLLPSLFTLAQAARCRGTSLAT
jgi:hypothetical protein